MSQLTDAEWLRYLAGTCMLGLVESDEDRLRSIADRLERPGVEGWSYRLDGVFYGFDTDRAFWVAARKFANKGEVVATTLTERPRTPEEDLMDRTGSRTGDNPLPTCNGL